VRLDDGRIALVDDDEAIRQSIWLILATARGERVMRPDFGCGIHDLVFALNDVTTASLVAAEVRTALEQLEPRIAVDDVTVEPDAARADTLVITVTYRVPGAGSAAQLVQPFHLDRGLG
jgi:uncharacterized protein